MKTKQTKKTVKKAPAKKSLIDGVYSHVFNCRLYPASGEQLELIMSKYKITAQNKVINLAVLEYISMKEEIEKLKEEKRELVNIAYERGKIITDTKNSFNKFLNFDTTSKINPDDINDDDDDERYRQTSILDDDYTN
jgi:hypothetical protein